MGDATCGSATSNLLCKSYDSDDKDRSYSVNEYIEMLGFGWFQVKLTFVIGLSWMSDAIAVNLLAMLGPAVQCAWNLSSEATAFISTCFFIGMFFGCWTWGWVCDKFGRRLTISACMLMISTFGAIGAFAPGHKWLLLVITLEGFGVGGVGQSMTLYSEFLPIAQRAAGLVFINLFYTIGAMLSAASAYFVIPRHGWRLYMVSSVIPVFLSILLFAFIPESPRFLVAASKGEKAMKALQRVAAANGQATLPGRLRVVPCWRKQERGRLSDLLTSEYRTTTPILWLMWFTSIFSYYGVILFTGVLLHKSSREHSGFDDHLNRTTGTNALCHEMKPKDYLDYLYTTTGEIPGLLLTFVFVEKLGRRMGIGLLFLVSALMISLLHIPLQRLPLVALIFVLRACLSAIVQAIYLYTPEVYPTNIRAIGLGTGSGLARIGAILTPFVSEVLIETSPHIAIGAYSALLLLCVLSACFLTKETKGKTLMENSQDDDG